MADPVAITFLRNTPPYMTGETAGFSAAQAKALVESGCARMATARQASLPLDGKAPKV